MDLSADKPRPVGLVGKVTAALMGTVLVMCVANPDVEAVSNLLDGTQTEVPPEPENNYI